MTGRGEGQGGGEAKMAEGGGGLDQFLTDLGTTDAKKKLTTGQVTTLSNLANFFCLKVI